MFSIILTTYNRHRMFEEALVSLLNQTYKNFEVIVCDRGSEPSVEAIIKKYNDPRVTYFQSSQEIDANDSGNEIVKMMKGDYFLFLADDDALCPSTLARVKKAFNEHPDCGIVQIALSIYYQNTNIQRIDKEIRNCLLYKELSTQEKDDVYVFPGKNLAIHFFSNFYIGDETEIIVPSAFHASGFFIRMENIREIFKPQGGLFVKPFGDVGYFSIAYNTNVCYINLPLSIIGKNHNQETSYFLSTNKKWKEFIKNPKYSPFDIPSFLNLTVEGTLNVIYSNGIDKTYNTYLRDSFYLKHLEFLLSDLNISDNFLHDFLIIMKEINNHKLMSKVDWEKFRKFFSGLWEIKYKKFKKFLRKNRLIPQKKVGDFGYIERVDGSNRNYLKEFKNINEFAIWLEKELIEKRKYIEPVPS